MDSPVGCHAVLSRGIGSMKVLPEGVNIFGYLRAGNQDRRLPSSRRSSFWGLGRHRR